MANQREFFVVIQREFGRTLIGARNTSKGKKKFYRMSDAEVEEWCSRLELLPE